MSTPAPAAPAAATGPVLVWAQSADGFIGRDGTLPWHLPEDLARFRALTLGRTVVMGRRTWDSLPARFRPLPGRRNVVLSRDRGLALPGAEVVHDVAAVLAVDPHPSVIGGAQVYAAFLPVAVRLEVTDVDLVVAGDTPAPVLDEGWTCLAADPGAGWATSSSGVRHRFRTLVRADGSAPDAAA